MWHADRPTWNTFSKTSRHMPAWLQEMEGQTLAAGNIGTDPGRARQSDGGPGGWVHVPPPR